MKLSNRLEMVVSFVKQCEAVADVGTDHGHVPVELVRRGIVSHAYAMDVRKGPLSKAEENIAAAGMKSKIETRLSDGVEKLNAGEAQSVIIAGMGGELVIHILEEGRHVWDTVEQWVLSPHSDLHKVREWVANHGFAIVKEDMVFEEGKYYTVMDVRKSDVSCGMQGEGDAHLQAATSDEAGADQNADQNAEQNADQNSEPGLNEEMIQNFRYGTYLRETKNSVFADFLKDEEEKLLSLKANLEKQAASSERARDTIKEIEGKLAMNRQVQKEVSGGTK